MDIHKQVAAWLAIVTGVLILLLSAGCVLVFGRRCRILSVIRKSLVFSRFLAALFCRLRLVRHHQYYCGY